MNSVVASAAPALDPEVFQAVQDSFSRQQAMSLIRATMPLVETGLVEIHLPQWEGIQQQHGYTENDREQQTVDTEMRSGSDRIGKHRKQNDTGKGAQRIKQPPADPVQQPE